MSNYLFANPTFLAGVASCIDIFGIYCMYNESSSPLAADKEQCSQMQWHLKMIH